MMLMSYEMSNKLKVEGERMGSEPRNFGKGGKWALHGNRSPSAEEAPQNRRPVWSQPCLLARCFWPRLLAGYLVPGLKLSLPNSPCYNSLNVTPSAACLACAAQASRQKSLHNCCALDQAYLLSATSKSCCDYAHRPYRTTGFIGQG